MAWSEVYEISAPSFPYEFHLHGLSDWQLGSESTSLSVIKQSIQEVLDDPVDSGVVFLGDIEDDDRPSTRRIRRSAFSDRPEVIKSDVRKHMREIDQDVIPHLLPLHQKTKYGIMGVIAGHHWTPITNELSSPEYICNRLNELTKDPRKKARYLGEMSAYMDLRFSNKRSGNRVRSNGFVQHGEGGGQTKASSVTKLQRTSTHQTADWYMRAHDCQLIAWKEPRLRNMVVHPGSAPKLLCENIPYLNLGAATQGYDFDKTKCSYIEQKMLRATTMGWGTLKIKIRKALNFEDPNNSYQAFYKVEL